MDIEHVIVLYIILQSHVQWNSQGVNGMSVVRVLISIQKYQLVNIISKPILLSLAAAKVRIVENME